MTEPHCQREYGQLNKWFLCVFQKHLNILLILSHYVLLLSNFEYLK